MLANLIFYIVSIFLRFCHIYYYQIMGSSTSKEVADDDDDGFATVTGVRDSEFAANEDDGFVTVKGSSVNDNALPGYSKPTFNKAREYYRSTIPHRLKDDKHDTGYRLARIGELRSGDEIAQEYTFWTPDEAFNEFGIGISLYFRTIKTLFVVVIVCSLISLVAINENAKSNPNENIPAGCATDDNCVQDTPDFLVGSVYGATRDSLKLSKQGAADIAVCVLLTVFSLAASFLEGDAIESADAAQQTIQDYSVVIKNPPQEVTDPQVYYDKYKRFGDIVFVTVARRNGALLRALANKKVLDSELTGILAVKTAAAQPDSKVKFTMNKQEDLTAFQLTCQATLGMYRTVEYLEKQLEVVNNTIRGLAQSDFEPWRVFITFDREKSRLDCLAATSVTTLDLWNNSQENHDAVLHGKCLKISGTAEATDVIWENSHYDTHQKIISWIISFGAASVIVVIAFYIVEALSNSGSVAVAAFVSILNGMLPYIVKTLTLSVEIHTERSSVESSMLLKLVVVRCINSGLLIYLAAQYYQTFRLTHLEAIQNILIFDAFLTPGLRVLDLDGYFYRHVLAKSAKTQHEMNTYFQGTEWTLAERYTDMLKTFFVGMFFSVPLPSGLFITAVAMVTTYWADRYCLFRIWKRPAQLDASLSVVARYFFVISVWAHVSISRIYFANWPYRVSFNSHLECKFCSLCSFVGNLFYCCCCVLTSLFVCLSFVLRVCLVPMMDRSSSVTSCFLAIPTVI